MTPNQRARSTLLLRPFRRRLSLRCAAQRFFGATARPHALPAASNAPPPPRSCLRRSSWHTWSRGHAPPWPRGTDLFSVFQKFPINVSLPHWLAPPATEIKARAVEISQCGLQTQVVMICRHVLSCKRDPPPSPASSVAILDRASAHPPPTVFKPPPAVSVTSLCVFDSLSIRPPFLLLRPRCPPSSPPTPPPPRVCGALHSYAAHCVPPQSTPHRSTCAVAASPPAWLPKLPQSRPRPRLRPSSFRQRSVVSCT